MSAALGQLLDAVATLADEQRTLALAVQAIHEACGRGLGLGMTSRGAASERMGQLFALFEGQPVEIAPSHLAYVRTPSYALEEVPLTQRNRWIEPFREGIATPEGWRKSTLYPFLARFQVLDFGRIAICAGSRQVGLIAAAVPEGTSFSEEERVRLEATAEALVVPLRVAAIIADATASQSTLQRMLDAREDAVLALDRAGEILDGSRAAVELLRQDRALPGRLRSAVSNLRRETLVLRSAGQVIHISRCPREVAFLAVVDGGTFAEAPLELTDRQRELLDHLERGLSNAEIGEAMGIAPSTVKTMLERLYERAQVGNRVELLSWARAAAPTKPRRSPG